ncbi:MAG: immune inhibitor A [Chloroflexi bacterium]|nr:immune inhibitor A [Chloroflexota bacterium]
MPGKTAGSTGSKRVLALPGAIAGALTALAVMVLLTGACQGGADNSPVLTVTPADNEVATGAGSPGAGEPAATRADAPGPTSSASVPPTATASTVISASTAGPASPTPEATPGPTAAATSNSQSSPTSQPTPAPVPGPSGTSDPSGAGSSSPVSPTPAATPAFVPIPDEPDIPIPPDRDLQDLGRRLVEGYVEPKTIVPSEPFVVGQKVDFWVSRDQGSVLVSGEVAYVSEHAYWIFENRFIPTTADIEQVAEDFESDVWPVVTGVFGIPLTPGIDGDDRIVVYHSILRAGVAGYFSAADSYPREILPFSNQREAVYLSVNQIDLTSREYLSVIAHELQHASHFAADSSEDSWVNEGLSEVAAEIAGFIRSAIPAFVRAPSTSLTAWAQDIGISRANYGATNLFFAFLATHYGGNDMLAAVSRNQEDGITSIDSALAGQGFDVGANDVFADWLVANYLNADEGPYSYENRSVPPVRNIYKRAPDSLSGEVRGYGADYIVTSTGSSRMTVEFQGQPETPLLTESPHSGDTCWWSNQGDQIDSTLTRSVDLSAVEAATLRFWTLYDIEEFWDYAYVMVSTDGGETWQILDTAHTTSMNPNGNAYGPGLTGRSGGWVQDTVDLSEYAGREVLLRFEYITDDAVFSKGACFDDFEISEIGWSDDTSTRGDWTAEGFALVEETVPTQYLVQVIHEKDLGDPVVYQVPVGAQGAGRLVVEGIGEDDLIVAIISAVTRHSTSPTKYTLSITP